MTREEYDRLIAECPPYIEPVVKLAYLTGMRRGEILGLTWGQIDLKEGIIGLGADDTKTKSPRDIPLCPELLKIFKAMPRGLPGVPIFTRKEKPVTGSTIRVGLEIACKRAEIEDFTFHDLRHCFTTNMRRAGVHDLVIMAITGHKTMSMFHRYNSVGKDELKAAAEKIGHPGHPTGHPADLDTPSKEILQG